ncbi:probable ATP-dependent RNA helicase DDX20 [Engraulis encrasicolus]|uniref:probable ATP-dependent RNA helicase DDX20 n=1 Tax=Engraulis encrasicolus TaxID=184585 RepID=UPI002FCF8C20
MAASMKKAAHEIESRSRTGDVLLSDNNIEFSSLLLSEPVLRGLTSAGFQRPSPIQLKAIPLGRCGLDLIVQAKSGTGKTCVFATIALDALIPENTGTQVLVLAPTREIAVQIHSVVMAIGSGVEGLECHVFIGGTPVSQDKTRLKKCHIAIGSPGRIKQLIEMGVLATASIRLFVLDEADKLLEEGSFQEQINWIFSSLPLNKQMLALSATYPESLAQHLTRYMRDPTYVRLNPTDPGLIGLRQFYRLVRGHSLPHKVFQEKVQLLLELYSRVPFNQSLVFSNLHSRAQQLADILSSKGLPAVCISSSLTQEQRLDAMSKLKTYQCRVLISTDLTSRGIDAEKVNLVVNLDVPQDWETYMHRIGRAGRFGTHGLAVTYCCHGEEENKMMMIAQKCSLNLTLLPDPIPEGLMEERCDWDVTKQPPLQDDLAPLSLPRRKKTAPSPSHTTNQEPEPDHMTRDEESHQPIRKQNANANASGARGSPAPEVQGRGDGERQQPKLKQPPRKDSAPQKQPPRKDSAPQKQPPRKDTAPPQAGHQGRGGEDGGRVDGTTAAAAGLSSREQQQLSLPKIPPLPSFKPRCDRPLRLEAAILDFERFMSEGPGRDVEIIRQYRGRGDEGDDDVIIRGQGEGNDIITKGRDTSDDVMARRRGPTNRGVESREDSVTILKDESRPFTFSASQRGRSNVTSHPSDHAPSSASSSSSSSSSESDTDEPRAGSQSHARKPLHSQPRQSTSHQSQSNPPKSRKIPERATRPHAPPPPRHLTQSEQSTVMTQGPPPARRVPQGGVAQRQEATYGHTPTHTHHNQWQNRTAKPAGESQPRHNQRGGVRRQQPQEEEEEEEDEEEMQVERDEEEEEEEAEEEAVCQDYWGRSYYEAWRRYYSSVPPPYWSAYNPAHNPAQAWMAAYRMSSVYMQEMMKED